MYTYMYRVILYTYTNHLINIPLYRLLLILYAHVYLCVHTNIHIHICIQVNYAMFFQLPMILNSHFDSSTANVISALYSVGMMPGMYVCM